jgi:anaerobic dimethyl sulfoxide reductase subunit A
MPEGLEKEESYKDYILGSFDGQPKDPEWAEAITSVPKRNHRIASPGNTPQ